MRDLYAGFALIGLLSKYGTGAGQHAEIAALAFTISDAMMAERKVIRGE